MSEDSDKKGGDEEGAPAHESIQERLVNDLRSLRRGRGVTLSRIAEAPTLLGLRSVAARARRAGVSSAAAALDLLIEALGTLGGSRESLALRNAYALTFAPEQETLVPAGSNPGTLTKRRVAFAAENDRIAVDTIENWENRGIDDLVQVLLDVEVRASAQRTRTGSRSEEDEPFDYTEIDRREDELRSVRERLVDLVADPPVSFVDDVKFTYFVSVEGKDRIRMEFSTTVDGQDPLPWRSLRFGVGQESASIESFAEIGLQAESDAGRVYVIPTDVIQRQVRVAVFFLPPITPTEGPRTWALTYEWTGAWDGLRENGEDRVEFLLSGRTRSRENVVILPAGTRLPAINAVTPPTAETWIDSESITGIALHWRIVNPHVGEYRFAVRGELPSSS